MRIALALCLIVSLVNAKPPGKGRNLTFEEEFDGTSVDPKRWRVVEGPRKGAINTARALSVKGGILRITTFTENGKHLTGFLSTDGRFEQVQGRFEARIRFSSVPGMWSAFWMMPMTYGRSKDPAKADIDGLELDIVEHLAAYGGHFDSTIHWGGYGPPHQRTRTQRNKPASPANEGWHTYAVEWTGKGYQIFYDGQLMWDAPKDIPVSRAPQHLKITSEVKDGGWAGKVPARGYGRLGESKAWMEVDWVRAWKLDGAN
jgi:beta-glucanase (GH16 family)